MTETFEREFGEFMSGHAQPPQEVSAAILSAVRRDLAPSPLRVGARVYFLGLILGIASLLVCPQFGLGYGPLGHVLHGVFMRFGALACSGLCGALLLSVITLLALLCLNREERRVAYRARYPQSLLVAVSLLAVFHYLGAAIVTSLAIVWLLGATLGGVASYHLRAAVQH